MVKFFNVFLVLWVICGSNFVLAQDSSEWKQLTRGQMHISKVLLDNANNIVIASDNSLCRSTDGGKFWFSEKLNGVGSINNIYLDINKINNVYICAERGFFLYSFENKKLIKIVKEKNCTSFIQGKNQVYLGTDHGVLVGTLKMDFWTKSSGELSNIKILDIIKLENSVYFVSGSKIICLEDKSSVVSVIFDKILVSDEFDEDIESNIDNNEVSRNKVISSCVIDLITKNIYISIGNKVFFTDNKGKEWQLINSDGLLAKQIDYLYYGIDSVVYAIVDNNIFRYQTGWKSLIYTGNIDKIRSLAQDKLGIFFAATQIGLLKLEATAIFSDKTINVKHLLNSETDIRKLHQAAIEYAEVNIDRIRKWRKEVKKKAWLPNVSIGANRQSTDLWHWETGSTTKSDDDNLRKGKDSVDWDVRFSWNLGDIFWNTDQSSIDSRAKLLVELRQEILDEVTRVYFERIRLKSELDNLSIIDEKRRFEKELKIEELTACLDGLTGGYFSKNKGKI